MGDSVEDVGDGEVGGDSESAVVKWRRRSVRERREAARGRLVSLEMAGDVRAAVVEGLGAEARLKDEYGLRAGRGCTDGLVKGPPGTTGGSGEMVRAVASGLEGFDGESGIARGMLAALGLRQSKLAWQRLCRRWSALNR